MRTSLYSLLFAGIVFALPFSAAAAVKKPSFEVSGWIPYWRAATGTADVLPHLDQLTEVSPFVYTLKQDGTLVDNGKLDQEPWKSFLAEAKRKKVRITPSIMSSNGELLHEILSDKKRRIALEDAITAEVKRKGYDGIDIDFEAKKAETRPYFSLFLKGLYQRMGNKWVMCTIEARTPPEDRFAAVPKNLEYANDFKQINKYCDRVRFMTYDQGRIDLKLNASSTGPYVPVADTRWVEKAIMLAKKDIAARKIIIGVPTYGYEYDVTAYADGYTYDRLWAFNPGYALSQGAQYGVKPSRGPSGELYLSYLPLATAAPARAGNGEPTSSDPAAPALVASAQIAAVALAAASSSNTHVTFRYATWSDAQAIAEKIALAKKLGVRGIAIFKLDGGQDPALWGVLPKVR